MKQICLISALLISSIASAQVKGNASYERQSKMDYNENYYANSYQQPSNGSKGGNISANAAFINDSTFVIEADLMHNQRADAYVAFLNINQSASTLDSANLLMNNRIEKFLRRLPVSVNRLDVYVDFISLVPTFEYVSEKKMFSKTYNEVPTGFELNKTLHIPYSDPEQLDLIMSAAIDGEIYDLVKVDYIVKDMKSIYDTLRNQAVDLILAKKQDYERLGMKFNAKFTVVADDITSTYPIERYKSYSAFSSSAVGYDKVKKTYIAKKNTASYYDKINYNEMDFVGNPVVVEPVVQFMYNLKIRYTLSK